MCTYSDVILKHNERDYGCGERYWVEFDDPFSPRYNSSTMEPGICSPGHLFKCSDAPCCWGECKGQDINRYYRCYRKKVCVDPGCGCKCGPCWFVIFWTIANLLMRRLYVTSTGIVRWIVQRQWIADSVTHQTYTRKGSQDAAVKTASAKEMWWVMREWVGGVMPPHELMAAVLVRIVRLRIFQKVLICSATSTRPRTKR